MTARARLANESFKDYRSNLKKENKSLKEYLKGKVFWTGSTYRKNKQPS